MLIYIIKEKKSKDIVSVHSTRLGATQARKIMFYKQKLKFDAGKMSKKPFLQDLVVTTHKIKP